MNEGYLRYGSIQHSGEAKTAIFYDAELTEQGFRVLNSVPASLKDKGRSLGAQLIDSAKQMGLRKGTALMEGGVDQAARRLIDLVQSWLS